MLDSGMVAAITVPILAGYPRPGRDMIFFLAPTAYTISEVSNVVVQATL